mgnify:FL=1
MKYILENKFWWAARSFAAVVLCVTVATAQGIFISEYSEGGSGFGSEKYLEIYNGTGAEIDLSNYAYASTTNAPTTVGEYEYWNNFSDGAVLAPGDVYVIAHPDAAEDISVHADQTNQFLSNGDDGYCLVSGGTWSDADEDGNIDAGEMTGYEIVDCLGDWNGDPGSCLLYTSPSPRDRG